MLQHTVCMRKRQPLQRPCPLNYSGRPFARFLQELGRSFATNINDGTEIKRKKCAFFQKQVKYLGHLVTADGISTDEDKIRAVKDWSHPQNLHELCSFLALHIIDALCLTKNQRCINGVSHR